MELHCILSFFVIGFTLVDTDQQRVKSTMFAKIGKRTLNNIISSSALLRDNRIKRTLLESTNNFGYSSLHRKKKHKRNAYYDNDCHQSVFMDIQQTEIKELEGEELTIKCTLMCNLPNATYEIEHNYFIEWKIPPTGETWTEHNANHSHINVNKTEGVLYINELRREHAGNYTCFVMHTDINAMAELVVLWIPDYKRKLVIVFSLSGALLIVNLLIAAYLHKCEQKRIAEQSKKVGYMKPEKVDSKYLSSVA